MKLIFVVGGVGQDKLKGAQQKFPDAHVTPHFSDRVRQALAENRDALEMTRDYLSFVQDELDDEDKLVVVSDEVGCGIVPMDRDERVFREANGRVNCLLAGEADEVYRVTAGIFMKIK